MSFIMAGQDDGTSQPIHQLNLNQNFGQRIALIFGLIIGMAGQIHWDAHAADRPNFLVILCDDLGIGDVGAFNPQSRIKTPCLDELARTGTVFTDAHSGSAVCTPTRYGLLTGRYCWRSRLQRGVLGGISPRLIESNVKTVADRLREEGYDTACFGKWHLGLDWARRPDEAPFTDHIEPGKDGWKVDFQQTFSGGPLSVGFNQYFGISASLDMVPYTFLVNDRVQVVPTVDKSFPMMLGKESKQTRRGPAAQEFDATDVLPKLTK